VTGNTLEGLLNIPEQTRPIEGSFDTRPKQVEAWIEALPIANTGECARQIYGALCEINRLAIPETDRVKAMEAFRAPVYHVTEVLKKHYVHQNLPLSPKNQKVAELSIQLHSQMALGYKSVIQSKLSKTFSLLSNKTLTKSIHRAIRYLSNVMLCAYQIYIQHPEHVWLHIHQLYLYAEKNNFHHELVKDHIVAESMLDSSIADLYAQILLLALAGPYRLRQNITDTVYTALQTWAPSCRVIPLGANPDSDYAFTINLNTDAAPGYFRDDGATDPALCRVVDTQEMTQVISDALRNASPTTIGIPEDILKRLLMTWSGKSHRAFSRSAKSNEIAITLGLSATHHYIDEIIRPLLKDSVVLCPAATTSLRSDRDDNDDDEQTAEDDVFQNDRANYTSAPVFGISNLDDHTPDVWDPDFTFRANNPIHKAPQKNALQVNEESGEKPQNQTSLCSPLSCKGINESAGGYCLLGFLVHGKDSQKVQIGELVGIRDNMDTSSTQLSIGIIRRIKSWKNGLELGIQKLAPCSDAIAIATVPQQGQSEKFQRGLVLPELTGISQPATLITHAWHQEKDRLIANVQGHRSNIELSKKIESTGVFSQFEFTVLTTTEEKNQQTQSSDPNNEFDSVWTLI